MINALEALPKGGDKWVTLDEWDVSDATYDADGWLDKWGERIGTSTVRLPSGGYADLTSFAAIRSREGTEND